MFATMRIRVSADDLTALDQRLEGQSRSAYIRSVLEQYTKDREKVMQMLSDNLGDYYETKQPAQPNQGVKDVQS